MALCFWQLPDTFPHDLTESEVSFYSNDNVDMKTELVSEPGTPQENIPTTVSRLSFADIIYKQGKKNFFITPQNQLRIETS